MGKPLPPPPPVIHMAATFVSPTRHQLEMLQMQTYLQAQLPRGVTVTQVERIRNEYEQDYSWAVHVYLAKIEEHAVVTYVTKDNVLPLDQIISKLNLLGM